jgi:large exoprotein involved in heme utilization and adhesion
MRNSHSFCLSTLFLCAAITQPAIAQITSSSGSTTVNTVGNQTNITGNQVSGNNQFHSFTTFNVDAGKTANFIPNNASIQNLSTGQKG